MVLLILSSYIGYDIGFETAKKPPNRKDTVYTEVVVKDSIYLQSPAKVVYKYKDSIIDKPNLGITFKASIDTIIGLDTIKINYSFPDEMFELDINRGSDTLRITQIEYVYEDENALIQIDDKAFFWGLISGIISMLVILLLVK